MTDLMLDLETLDLIDTSVVVAVGGQVFRLEEDGFDEEESMYAVCKFQDQIDLGRTISADTIEWWMTQGNAARSSTFSMGKFDSSDVLDVLDSIIKDYDVQRIWGNGSGFDVNIMRSVYRSFGRELPLRFTKDMDLRTLRMAAKNPAYPKTRTGVHHNALDDARYQVICAQMYWREINGVR